MQPRPLIIPASLLSPEAQALGAMCWRVVRAQKAAQDGRIRELATLLLSDDREAAPDSYASYLMMATERDQVRNETRRLEDTLTTALAIARHGFELVSDRSSGLGVTAVRPGPENPFLMDTLVKELSQVSAMLRGQTRLPQTIIRGPSISVSSISPAPLSAHIIDVLERNGAEGRVPPFRRAPLDVGFEFKALDSGFTYILSYLSRMPQPTGTFEGRPGSLSRLPVQSDGRHRSFDIVADPDRGLTFEPAANQGYVTFIPNPDVPDDTVEQVAQQEMERWCALMRGDTYAVTTLMLHPGMRGVRHTLFTADENEPGEDDVEQEEVFYGFRQAEAARVVARDKLMEELTQCRQAPGPV